MFSLLIRRDTMVKDDNFWLIQLNEGKSWYFLFQEKNIIYEEARMTHEKFE